MTDIIERLRAAPLDMNPHLKEDAAKEIERLRAALKVVSEDCYLDEYQMEFRPTSAALTARAALSFPSGNRKSEA